jgi:cysteine desulfuration protein SufE
MEIRDLIDNFSALEAWEDRYAYIIELGRSLPPLAQARKNDATLVRGCASNVWMDLERGADGRHHFKFDSDALVVKGLLYIIYALFEGKTAAEIGGIDAEAAFDRLGLKANLTAQRLAGLESVVAKIRSLATKV